MKFQKIIENDFFFKKKVKIEERKMKFWLTYIVKSLQTFGIVVHKVLVPCACILYPVLYIVLLQRITYQLVYYTPFLHIYMWWLMNDDWLGLKEGKWGSEHAILMCLVIPTTLTFYILWPSSSSSVIVPWSTRVFYVIVCCALCSALLCSTLYWVAHGSDFERRFVGVGCANLAKYISRLLLKVMPPTAF